MAVGISETWLSPDLMDDMFEIPDYKLIRSDRESRGGGVALYMKSSISKSCTVLSIPLEEVYDIEYIIVKVTIEGKLCAIGVLYKPPNSHYTNLCILTDIISYLLENNIHILILMGDLNINMLINSPATVYLNNLLLVLDCKQIVNDPTRITAQTETLLDLIITNSDLDVRNVEVLDVCFSDHNVTSCDVELNGYDYKPLVKEFRSFRNFNIESFNLDASAINWNTIYNINSLDEKVDFLNVNLLNLFNYHAPIKRVTSKSNKRQEPWFTETLYEIKKIKRKAWLRYKKTRSAIHRQYFCEIRNYYNNAVIQERIAFYSFHINNTKNNPKQMWTNLKSWGVVKENIPPNLPEILCNADDINNYFMDSIPNLKSSEQHNDTFLETRFMDDTLFTFKPVTVQKIIDITNKQKPHTIGSDGLSAKMLQLALQWISAPLTHIINISLELGILPIQWKTSCIKPIPKKKNPEQLGDLRPISLLSVPLKITESAIYEQLSEYIFQNSIIPSNQSGFRKGFSTSTLLSNITDEILRAIDNTKVTSLTLLDMTKAFDSLDINCLIAKLSYYGISGSTFSWFQNYLNGRQQFTSVNTGSSILTSQIRSVVSGVPQGSVLGPLLFNIFTADISRLPLYSKLYMYADDIQLIYSFSSSECQMAEFYINNDLGLIYEWTTKNTLVLNANKSQNIVFGTSQQLLNLSELNIQINNNVITSTNSVKNLGVNFDSLLSFSGHVSTICKKAFYSLKQLYAFKKYLDTNTKILLSETMVLSHLNYADIVYGPCLSQEDKYRLQKIENCCVRYFTTVPQYGHITPHLRDFNLLNMCERRFIHIVGFVLNIFKTGKPNYLFNKIQRRTEIHNRDLRNVQNKVCIPSHKNSSFRSSFSFIAAYIINNLPIQYHNLSVATVKSKLKEELILSRLENIDVQMF